MNRKEQELFRDYKAPLPDIQGNGYMLKRAVMNLLSNAVKFTPRQGTEGEKSFGLGLYITKMVVERHRGSLSLESPIDEGSRFTIELPCRF